MSAFRSALRDRPALAGLILLAAMLLRLIVPAGYMPDTGGGFALAICAGAAPASATPAMDMAMPGMGHHGDDAAPPQSSCAFAALSLPALPGTDAVLLADAIGHIMATAMLPTRPVALAEPPHLRPPLRGPPVSRT